MASPKISRSACLGKRASRAPASLAPARDASSIGHTQRYDMFFQRLQNTVSSFLRRWSAGKQTVVKYLKDRAIPMCPGLRRAADPEATLFVSTNLTAARHATCADPKNEIRDRVAERAGARISKNNVFCKDMRCRFSKTMCRVFCPRPQKYGLHHVRRQHAMLPSP